MKVKYGTPIFLLSLLISCGNVANKAPDDRISGGSGASVTMGTPELQALSFGPNQDWLEGLRKIAFAYHAFGGYTIDHKQQEIVIYTANSYRGRAINEDTIERGRKLGLIRQAFINLMNASQPPLVTNNGEEADIKRWKIRFEQTDASLDDLLYWKDALFLDADNNQANLLGFSMEGNKTIIQVRDESLKPIVIERLRSLGIPESKVELRFGEIRATKQNNVDQYRPVVGGVRVTMPSNQPGYVGVCTLGLPVLLDGSVEGYLTAGHCVQNATSNNGERMSQDNYAVATKYLDPAFLTCTSTSCGSVTRYRQADVVFYKSDIYYSRARIIRTALTPGT